MSIFLVNIIENFFILWFVLTCFNINILQLKFFVIVLISTICAISIQQLHLFNNLAIDLIINMIIGISFYIYLLKISYPKNVKIIRCLKYLTIYFVIFMVMLEIILADIYYPFLGSHYIDNDYYKLLISIPARLIQCFAILFIQYKKRRNINDKLT